MRFGDVAGTVFLPMRWCVLFFMLRRPVGALLLSSSPCLGFSICPHMAVSFLHRTFLSCLTDAGFTSLCTVGILEPRVVSFLCVIEVIPSTGYVSASWEDWRRWTYKNMRGEFVPQKIYAIHVPGIE